jgi:hypothetical protein
MGNMNEGEIITLQLHFTRRKAWIFLITFFICWHPGFLGSETLRLTTYYPAPYGGYVSLLTTGKTLLARDSGAVVIGSSLPTGPTVKLAVMGGRVGIGTLTPGYALDVVGVIHASGADLAEGMLTTGDVEPNDVVIIDEENSHKIKRTGQPYNAKVVGVIAQSPGLRIGPGRGKKYKPLALAGQVPCKVTAANGPIMPGDSLTTSSIPGYAMKLELLPIEEAKTLPELQAILKENERRSLATFGKALEPWKEGEGKITVLLRR